MASSQSFGVTYASVLDYLPQIDVASDAPLTPTRAAALVTNCAAEVNGAIVGTWGSGAPEAIAALGSGDAAYQNAARCICVLAAPDFYRAAHHGVDQEVLAALQARADELRARLRTYPASEIGYSPVAPSSATVQTSTGGLLLPNDETSSPQRGRYGGNWRPGKRGGMVW